MSKAAQLKEAELKITEIEKNINKVERMIDRKTHLLNTFRKWLSAPNGPSKDQVIRISADAFLGGSAGIEILGNVWRGFGVGVAKNGARNVLSIKEGQECTVMSINWLSSRIGFILRKMATSEELHDKFIFGDKHCRELTKTIINESKDIPFEEISPVKFLSENEGLCWKKLDFDPIEGNTDNYQKVLKNINSHIQIESMQQFFGALFVKNANPQNVLNFFGETRCGKGIISQFAYDIFDGANGSMPMKINEQWLGGLLNVRLVVGGDQKDYNLIQNDTIKMITGQDPVNVKILYSQPFSTKLNCMIMLSSNEKPAIEEDAVRERIIPVEFSKRHENRDDDLKTKVWDERSAIVWEWINSWRELVKLNGGIIYGDEELKDDLQSDTNEFMESKFWHIFKKSPGSKVGIADVYRLMGVTGDRESSRRVLTKWLKSQEIKKTRDRKNNLYLFRGITIRHMDN